MVAEAVAAALALPRRASVALCAIAVIYVLSFLAFYVADSVGHFWSFPHSQLYAEPARLAEAGLLTVEQEDGGRRRRRYSIAADGQEALQAWLAEKPVPHWRLSSKLTTTASIWRASAAKSPIDCATVPCRCVATGATPKTGSCIAC